MHALHECLSTGVVSEKSLPQLKCKVSLKTNPAAEAEMCFRTSQARIHLERANEQIKKYEILRHIPANF